MIKNKYFYSNIFRKREYHGCFAQKETAFICILYCDGCFCNSLFFGMYFNEYSPNYGNTRFKQSYCFRCSDMDFRTNGATGDNGVYESDINLKIVKKLQYLLEQAGCTVILTRSDENGIYSGDDNSIRSKKLSDMKNRVEIGNSSDADIFISVHLNKINEEKYYGWQTFFKKNDEKSKALAISIQNGLNDAIQKENKRKALKIENKYIIDNVKIPITIVECGFLSNIQETNLLQTDEYQNKLAWGIYLGIINFLMN